MCFIYLNRSDPYALLADLILLLHTLYIIFVVLGFGLILAGIGFKWSWVKNFWIRAVHLLAMLVVVLKPLTGRFCPLTTWENQLRKAAGEQAYAGTFIQYWLQQLIYFDFPLWIFSISYIIFTLLILLTWVISPPKWPFYLQPDDPSA